MSRGTWLDESGPSSNASWWGPSPGSLATPTGPTRNRVESQRVASVLGPLVPRTRAYGSTFGHHVPESRPTRASARSGGQTLVPRPLGNRMRPSRELARSPELST